MFWKIRKIIHNHCPFQNFLNVPFCIFILYVFHIVVLLLHMKVYFVFVFLVYMVFCLYTRICAICMKHVRRPEEGARYSGTRLQMFVSPHVFAGDQSKSSARTSSALNHLATSPFPYVRLQMLQFLTRHATIRTYCVITWSL